MTAVAQAIRDRLLYYTGYARASSISLPTSVTDFYGFVVSNLTRLISLPLPFLSFLVVPFFSGTSTTISLLFFYLTWSAFVLSHDQLTVELYGTVAIRFLCFLLPALGFVAFDSAMPKVARGIKNRGTKQLPRAQFGRDRLLEIVGFAVLNVSLAIALELLLEVLATEVLHVKSIFKVTSFVPLPWTIIKDVAFGFAFRGVLLYVAHRYLLHTVDSPMKTWHQQWQHSVALPFSIVAAYDHPVNYLVTQWLPTFLPAYLGRWHVLTWHLFIALCSLEELFIYSGYAVLPSTIVLLGMARRTDEHFAVVFKDNAAAVGNFGRWGILDFVCGTACSNEDDAVDDLQKEAEKHNVKSRGQSAIDGAISGIKGKTRSRSGGANKAQTRSSKN